MSLTTILSELWRFIKDKFIAILIGSIVFSMIFVLIFQIFVPKIEQSQVSETEVEEPIELTDEQYKQSNELLNETYSVQPAEFEIFVQSEDGMSFNNSFIFDEYFTTPEVVSSIEDETGIEFSEVLETEKALNIEKDAAYRGSIAGIRNTSTNIITLRFQVGKTPDENLAIAEAYLSLIENNDIPFATNLTMTVMKEPENGEFLSEDDQLKVSSPVVLNSLNPIVPQNEISITQVVIFAIIGLIVGLLFMTVLMFIIQLFRQKITYAFQYSWDFEDEHLLYKDRNNTEHTIDELINYPSVPSRIVVYQTNNGVNDLLDVKDTPSEIVILVESGVTEKDWYSEQYRLAEILGSHIKIIQTIKK